MNGNKLARALGAGLLFTAGSCAEVQALTDEVARLKNDVEWLREKSKLGWRTALCSRDARLLLSAVQQECEHGQCDLESPPQEVLHVQVCKLDPKRRERFLEILSQQERETFYLYSNTKELSVESRERLRDLVLETKPLPTTRFLVVTRPWEREPDKRKHAEQRGRVVQNEILNLLIPYFKTDPMTKEGAEPVSTIRKRRTLLWTYEFPLRPGMRTRPGVMPPPQKAYENWTNVNADAPPDDERAVWVFRVDC
ncbi:MAG: hypothetical protein U1A78_23090 [Polyangia bacterium]